MHEISVKWDTLWREQQSASAGELAGAPSGGSPIRRESSIWHAILASQSSVQKAYEAQDYLSEIALKLFISTCLADHLSAASSAGENSKVATVISARPQTEMTGVLHYYKLRSQSRTIFAVSLLFSLVSSTALPAKQLDCRQLGFTGLQLCSDCTELGSFIPDEGDPETLQLAIP